MLTVLRQRHFALLWVGGLISGLGDGALRLTLPFYVYVRTGSVPATGAMFVVPLLPSLFLGSLAGVFVDRWDRRRTMIVADLTRALLILLLLAVQSHDWLWLVYAVGFLESALSQFFRPATSALVPRLVGEGHLQAANSLVAVSDGLIGVVGPAVGGLLLGFLGLPSVVLADSASYLLSGLLIALIRMPAEPPAGLETPTPPAVPPPTTTAAWIAVWREWLDGLRLMTTERVIAVLLLLIAASYVADGLALVVWVPYVRGILRASALQYGWLASAASLGAVLGGLGLGVVSRVVTPARLVLGAFGALGAVFLLEATVPVFPLVLGLSFLVGTPIVALDVSLTTLLQHSAPDRYRGRVFGTMGTTISLAVLAGMGLGGALGSLLGVPPVLALAGGIDLGFGLLALVMLHRTALREMGTDTAPREEPVTSVPE